MSVAAAELVVSAEVAGGRACALPSNMPDRTALGPATLVTVMVTEPPAATLIGTLTQAPCEKSVRSEERRVGKEWRSRMLPRHQATYQYRKQRWSVPLSAAGKLRRRRY